MTEPVIIIGGGPVGLILALVLARAGASTIVLEERSSVTPIDESRAISWMPRGLELLEWLGLYDVFECHAVKRTSHEFWAGGHHRLSVPIGEVDSPHPHTLDLPQHWSEALIEEAAVATGLVDLKRGSKVIGVSETEGKPLVRVQPSNGREYTLEASWVAVCDGFRSPTRAALRLNTTRRDYGADAAVADFQITRSPLPSGVSRIFLDAERPYGLFKFGVDRWRLVYRLNRGEDRVQMTSPEAASAILRRALPGIEPLRFLWASAFRLGQQQSANYRSGRFVLAGDAAHGMGPSAGAGLQVGALGAWRLGWRLALAAKGHASAIPLLDDYAREQRAASHQVQTENMLIFRNLAVRSPLLAAGRASLLSMFGRIGPLTRRMAEAVTLEDQHVPVLAATDRPKLSGSARHANLINDWRVGHRMPLAALSLQPASLDTHGCEHMLFPVRGSEEQCSYLIRQLQNAMAVPNHVIATARSPARQRGKPAVAVVRPDQEIVALAVGPAEHDTRSD